MEPICGGSTQFNSYPLWYPHYDNWASFGDFSSFVTSFCGAYVRSSIAEVSLIEKFVWVDQREEGSNRFDGNQDRNDSVDWR
jgi:hypothetical protein